MPTLHSANVFTKHSFGKKKKSNFCTFCHKLFLSFFRAKHSKSFKNRLFYAISYSIFCVFKCAQTNPQLLYYWRKTTTKSKMNKQNQQSTNKRQN